MPRDHSKSEDMSSRCNRYSPLGRRSPLDMPTPPHTPPPPVPAAPSRSEGRRRHSYVRRSPAAETPMSTFHAQLVEKLNEKIESRELQLASDAETLTADEGSDSSNDSWSSRDNWSNGVNWGSLDSSSSRSSRDSSGSPDILGAGDIYPGGFPPAPQTPDVLRQSGNEGPKVVVEQLPRLDEPMEIVADEQPSPLQQLLVFHRPSAAVAVSVESEDGDDSSETSSFWQSDEDEEIQRACLEESDEESDEDLDEASSGRVNRPQVDSPQYYYYVPQTQPLSLMGYAQQEQPYWSVDQLEPAQTQLAPVMPQEQQGPGREYNEELMDQDDQEPHFEQATNAITHQLPTRPIIQYGAQARHHLAAEQSPLQERELNYPFSRYAMQPEPDNNNYIIAGDYLPHTNYRCYHCGSPYQGMMNTYQQVTIVQPVYYAPLVANRNTDFSVERLLSSDENLQ